MVRDTTSNPINQSRPAWKWEEPPQPPTDLIFDDGEPLESNRHRIAMNVLIRSAQQAFADRPDFFAGGNMFVYYSRHQRMNQDFRGPDFFAAMGVDGSQERQGWVVWEEDGHYPDVIVELASPSTVNVDRTVKKELYEQTFRTPNYFIFDPFDPNSLQGWHLRTGNKYEALTPNERGWLWCEVLQLWLGTWEGTIDREPPTGTCHWLRFYDQAGNLVPLPEESVQQEVEQERQRAEQASLQAELERQRAERLAARLRELGEDPERL